MLKVVLITVFFYAIHLPVAKSISLFPLKNNPSEQENVIYYLDTTNNMTIAEVLKLRSKFTSTETKPPFFTNKKSTCWYSFTIDSSKNRGDYFCMANFLYDDVQIYSIDKNNNIVYESQKVNEPYLSAHSYYYKQSLPFSYCTGCTYFVKATSSNMLPLAYIVYHRDDFIDKMVYEYVFYGVFYGILFILFIYNLIFVFVSKEIIYLYYSLYIAFFSLYSFVDWNLLGYFYKYSYSNHLLYSIPFALMTIFLNLYYVHFINLKSRNITYYNAILVLILVRVLLELIVIVFPSYFPFKSYAVTMIVYIDPIMLFTIWAMSIDLQFKDRFETSKFMLYIFILPVVAYIISPFIPENIFSIFGKRIFYLFGMIETIMFALVLSYRYIFFKESNEKAMLDIIEQMKINAELKSGMHAELEQRINDITAEIKKESEQILEKNQELVDENAQLKSVSELKTKEKILLKNVSYDEFKQLYPNEKACNELLIELKWSKGYKCRKCKSTQYNEGPLPNHRRCANCYFIESPTSHTIFHHVRFPIEKAFYILYVVYSRTSVTIEELSTTLNLRLGTCHAFKQKAQKAIDTMPKRKTKGQGWTSIIITY